MATNRRKHSTKILASVALVAGAASIAGLGTFGAFTSATSAAQEVTAGTITLGQAEKSVQKLGVAVGDVLPGDKIDRSITLTRDAESETFGSVAFTSTVTPGASGVGLHTDLVGEDALTMAVDLCPTAWTPKDATKELTCSGDSQTVLTAPDVALDSTDLTKVTEALNADSRTAYLRFRFALPEAAPNALQGATSKVKFEFTATQRAGGEAL